VVVTAAAASSLAFCLIKERGGRYQCGIVEEAQGMSGWGRKGKDVTNLRSCSFGKLLRSSFRLAGLLRDSRSRSSSYLLPFARTRNSVPIPSSSRPLHRLSRSSQVLRDRRSTLSHPRRPFSCVILLLMNSHLRARPSRDFELPPVLVLVVGMLGRRHGGGGRRRLSLLSLSLDGVLAGHFLRADKAGEGRSIKRDE
jgi:hypothetical protein